MRDLVWQINIVVVVVVVADFYSITGSSNCMPTALGHAATFTGIQPLSCQLLFFYY